MNPIRVTHTAWTKIRDIINRSNNKFGFGQTKRIGLI